MLVCQAFAPLWSEETYRQVRRELGSRAPGSQEIATALSRVCFCARCGHAMVHGDSGRNQYYRCTVHAHKSYTGETCHPNNTRQEKIAQALNDALLPALEGDVDVGTLAAGTPRDPDRVQAQRDRLHEQLAAVEEKRTRLALAFADGTVQPGPYRSADDELMAALEAILTSVRALEQRELARPDPAELDAALRSLRDHWRESEGAWLLEQEHKHELNAALRRLGIRIMCEDCEVTEIIFLG